MSLSLGPDLPEVSRAAVFGLAKSGLATIRALLSRGVSVVATDAAPAEKLGAFPADERLELVLGGHPPSLLSGVDLCVVSPGVPMSLPVLDVARASGIPVIAEVELASRLVPGLVVGITGTNGKSTTTALAAALLRDAGREAVACGNFGTPWIHYAADGDSPAGELPPPSRVWVVELSSFQLEGLRRFAPDVAVHLNLTPDHLDRYRSVDDYGAAKARIFENQGEAQVAVLNADDPLVARIRTRARQARLQPDPRPGARRVAEGRRLPRRRRPGRGRASTPGARTCSSPARTTPRTPSPPSPRRFPSASPPRPPSGPSAPSRGFRTGRPS